MVEETNTRKIGKTISIVVIFTLIAKLMGFFREIMLSYFFGATGLSDAYLISQNIPGTIFLFVGTGLTTCFMPVYYRILSEKKEADAKHFVDGVITIVLCFATIVIIITCVCTPIIVKLFAVGFKGDTLYYAIWFTRIGIFSTLFSAVIYVYSSFLQVNKNFNVPAISAIPYNVFIMLSIIIAAQINVWFLAVGSVIAVAIQFFVLIPAVHQLDYRFKISFNWGNRYIKLFFKLMVPVVVGVSVNEINPLIDRTIASQVAVGGISALTYANSLIQLVQGGLIQPIITVFYPNISMAVSEHNNLKISQIITKTIMSILVLLIPITIFFVLFGRLIVVVLFCRGAFDETAVELTSVSVVLYAIGLCFVGVREVISRYFYANSNTKAPMINASIGMIINVILNIILSRIMGIGGLALASSIAAIITVILLMIECNKNFSQCKIGIESKQLIKIVIVSIVMGIVSYSFYSWLNVNKYLMLIIIGLFSCVVYIIMGYLIGIDFIRDVTNIVKDKVTGIVNLKD